MHIKQMIEYKELLSTQCLSMFPHSGIFQSPNLRYIFLCVSWTHFHYRYSDRRTEYKFNKKMVKTLRSKRCSDTVARS